MATSGDGSSQEMPPRAITMSFMTRAASLHITLVDNEGYTEVDSVNAPVGYGYTGFTQNAVGPLVEDSRYGAFKQMLLAVTESSHFKDMQAVCRHAGPSFVYFSEEVSQGPIHRLFLWTVPPVRTAETTQLMSRNQGFRGKILIPLTSAALSGTRGTQSEDEWLTDDSAVCWSLFEPLA